EIGTNVTISGTAFAANPASDVVKFNGTRATVLSASVTTLSVNVPAGATSGPIQVTTPSGTAKSGNPFTVRSAAGPSISSFNPSIGTIGTVVTVNGKRFDPTPSNDALRFGSVLSLPTTATAQKLTATVPRGATSGRISVGTPNGSTVSGDFF